MTSLARLQLWYHGQCDGDWDDQYGVHIETLDNPGWSVKIDLEGADYEEQEFVPLQVQRSEDDWFFISRTPEIFRIGCGPHNLEECFAIFCDRAGVPVVQ